MLALETLVQELSNLESQRYLAPRICVPKHRCMIDELNYWAAYNHQRFRGFARMQPQAFDTLANQLKSTVSFSRLPRCTIANVREQLAVALYRLGRSGNAAGVRDVGHACGCSEGSVHNWTQTVVEGLNELAASTVVWANEEERNAARDWVIRKSGVEEWGSGWAVVDGTHINLAWKPNRNHREYFNYKGKYSMNVQLVMLPHSMRIIECVIGFPGSAQDSRVWAGGSRVLREPHLFLDKGEFIWTDGGYGYSPFTVGVYSHIRSEAVHDLRQFNYYQSLIRGRAEHGISYLKQRFQALKSYRGNMYRLVDEMMVSKVIMACIVAHTIASTYDQSKDVAQWLVDGQAISNLDDALNNVETTQTTSFSTSNTQLLLRQRAKRQHDFKRSQENELIQLGERKVDRLRKDRALDLREKMHASLFRALDLTFVDTDADSRRKEAARRGL
ncbi:hypothetical protein CBS101457_005304 [Exobasidium rhododendri]|nr:hypothetical protein CBS101457_005304 [Exobasidium rhododendri]